METTELVEVKRGLLSSGKLWHLIPCRKKDTNIIDGKHLILELGRQLRPEDLTPEDISELRLLAFNLAEKFASKPGKWRVDANGSAVGTNPHFHMHIKLPAGADELARLVG